MTARKSATVIGLVREFEFFGIENMNKFIDYGKGKYDGT